MNLKYIKSYYIQRYSLLAQKQVPEDGEVSLPFFPNLTPFPGFQRGQW